MSVIFTDILKPEYIDYLVAAVKIVSNFSENDRTNGAASYALHQRKSLTDIIDIANYLILKKDKIISKESLDNSANILEQLKVLRDIIENNWEREIGSLTLKDMTIKTLRNYSKKLLHLTEDVMKLREYCLKKAENAVIVLKSETNQMQYNILVEVTFILILLHNRKRVDDIQFIELSDVTQPDKIQQEDGILAALTETERILTKFYKKIHTIGKGSKELLVLISRDVQNFIDTLVTERIKYVDISNKYFFTNFNSANECINGCHIQSKYAKECGAKRPQLLQSCRLRKHIATMMQLMDLRKNEIGQLASFMGNTKKTHTEFCRLPKDVTMIANVSKILLQLEKGEFLDCKNKHLDEIDVHLDEPLLSNSFSSEAEDKVSKITSNFKAAISSNGISKNKKNSEEGLLLTSNEEEILNEKSKSTGNRLHRTISDSENEENLSVMPRKAVGRTNKSPQRIRATLEQMSSLLDFIQKNKIVRLGIGSADVLRSEWNALARQVNAVGGAIKTGKSWKKAYIEWKSHVRMKLRKGETLTKLNKRCAELAELDTADLGKPIVKILDSPNERRNKNKIVKSFPKKASSKQMSSLLEFIQQNEYLCSGLGTADVQKAGWDALSRQVNAAGAATKTPEGWRKAYMKWKSHIRIKLRKGEPLSQQEKAYVHLAGPSITDRCKSMAKELGVPDKHENKNTFRARKATPDQMSCLLDFIQQNENFRVSERNAGGSQADWESLTRQLNAVRGTTKTVKGWKKTHTEWRSHVRMKLKQRRVLSKLDKRCAHVMGLNADDTNKSTGKELGIQERQENKKKLEKTSRAKKASSEQFSSLLDFVQENENIRLGKGNADDLTAGWETLTLQLNSLEGSTKTTEGWRKTYTEWKSHVRLKCKKGETLSEQDKRCAHLMGLNTSKPDKSTESILGSLEKQENQEKIENRSGAKRATSEQLSNFLDFLQENENFRIGKGNADELTAGWQALTLQLNALDGCIKTAEGWKKSYTEWKSHIRMKLRKGGTLSGLDERCMHLAGLDKPDRGKSTVKDLGLLDDQKNKKKIQKTPRSKRATSQQMWSLLDFIQQNDKFRLGKGTADDLKASWEVLTQQLNALGGTVKTVEGWKKAYTEWKSHVRMKLRKGETLSIQDKRCAYLEGLKLPVEVDTVDFGNSIEKEGFPHKQKSKEQIQRVFRPKKATSAQMISLLDFIQENENFCFGKGTADDLNANWEALTLQLNTLGGSNKTIEGWKKTYTEWRSNVRSRLRRRDPLSKLDRRYVHLARFNTVALGKSTARVQDNSDVRRNAENIVKKSRNKRATAEQLSTILDFIQQNDNFRLDEGTAEDRKAYWEALTLQLNSLGGTIKTVDGWKKAYSEWKSHVRIKLRRGEILSEQDKRCVHLAGLNRIDRGKLKTKTLRLSEEQANRVKASRNKRATADQMSSLLDFIEENENIRVGKGNVDDLKAGWEALTRQLNSVGGASKTVEGWKKTHTEWKSHVRRKVRRGEPLSKLDRRCAHLAGLKAVAFGKLTVQESGNPNQWGGNREKIVTKSRAKRATSEHMSTILDFIQQNDNFRLCKGTADDLKAGWETLSMQLNSIGGTTKTTEGWKKAYVEWKSHVRMKLRRGMILSRLDKRCAQLAGLNVVTINEATGKEFSCQDEQEKVARTPCGKRATSEQMSSLLDFIQQNDSFRLGNGSVEDLNLGWESLTRQLNGVRGTIKTVEGWKKAFTEWKSHVRIRLRKGETLSNQDKRLAHLAELNRIDLDKSIVKELEFLTELGNGEISEKTSRAKKATSDQMSSLLDFFEQNEYFCLGNGTPDDLRAGWEAVTQELNAIGGATKTVEGWKKTYTEWKSHVRMKLRKGEILSEQDRRCAGLAGLDTVGHNMPTVRELDFSYEQHNRGLDEGKSEVDEGKNETIGIKYFKDLIDLKNVEIVQELNENTSEPSSSIVQVFLPNVIKKRRPS